MSQTSPNYHILLGSRSLDKGKKALEEIYSSHDSSLKSSISLIQIDVTDRKSIFAAKDLVESEHGRLDVLINNAGIIVTRKVDSETLLRESFETNSIGPYVVTEVFEPLLKKSKEPRLIHVSSDLGSVTQRLDPNTKSAFTRAEWYRMSKAALNMLAACHRYTFAGWGCKVCAFNPGFTVTSLTGEAGRKMRIQHGARDAREPAEMLVKIIMGDRDADFEKSGIIDIDGGVLPW